MLVTVLSRIANNYLYLIILVHLLWLSKHLRNRNATFYVNVTYIAALHRLIFLSHKVAHSKFMYRRMKCTFCSSANLRIFEVITVGRCHSRLRIRYSFLPLHKHLKNDGINFAYELTVLFWHESEGRRFPKLSPFGSPFQTTNINIKTMHGGFFYISIISSILLLVLFIECEGWYRQNRCFPSRFFIGHNLSLEARGCRDFIKQLRIAVSWRIFKDSFAVVSMSTF